MKAHKYIIVSAILALGIAAPAVIAQDSGSAPGKGRQHQGPPGGPRGDMSAPLLKGITLTDDQQKKVDAINADIQKQFQDAAGDRTKMRGIMETRVTKIREVLTEDQQKTFDQNVKDLRSRFQGKGGPGGPGGKGSKGGKGGGAPKADAPAEE